MLLMFFRAVMPPRERQDERIVALKIAHPELARDPEFTDRFIGEARAVARLSSPNVVAVFDQGSTGDLNYIAMEYVPGPTLRELLSARGRLSPREALDIIEGVLTGLGENRVAFVARNDVAAAAAGILVGGGHAGAIYNATGPERLSGADRAALIAEITGRPLAFLVITEEKLRAGLTQAGLPLVVVNVVVSIQASFAAGAFDIVTGDVERLGGRPPKPLRDVLAGALKPPSA